MPYITEATRTRIETEIDSGGEPLIQTAGELNYLLTEIVILFLKQKGLNYQTCNDIVGALDNAKHEFRRRIQDTYEESKMYENGDVYPTVFSLLNNKEKSNG